LIPFLSRWNKDSCAQSIRQAVFGPLPRIPEASTNLALRSGSKWVEAKAIVEQYAFPIPVCPQKCWDHLIAIAECPSEADVLEVGCGGSYFLDYAQIAGVKGRKIGIDLDGGPSPHGITRCRGDFLKADMPSESFDYIACLSTIEHGIDLRLFSEKVARILRPRGKVTVSFDFWLQKIATSATPFGLPWCIFDGNDVGLLVYEMRNHGLFLTGDLDLSCDEPTVSPGGGSPSGDSYTFACLTFEKK
jgi:SAM-dependent methyltransferase